MSITLSFTKNKGKTREPIMATASGDLIRDVKSKSEDFQFKALTKSESDGYNLKELMKVFDSKVALQSITNSDLMNQKKKNQIVQRVVSGNQTYFIVPDVRPNKSTNAMSFNRYMAVCIATVCMHKGWSVYRTTARKYEAVANINPNELKIDDSFGNKLAYSAGFNRDHKYHWFYTTGYEYTFPAFPAEVIAMTMFKWAHRAELKLASMDPVDIVGPTIRQIVKMGDFKRVVDEVGTGTIKKRYIEIIENRRGVVTDERYQEIVDIFKNIAETLEQEHISGVFRTKVIDDTVSKSLRNIDFD
nr:nucleoprotein [Callicarpa mosaic-associated virus 1]